MPVSHPHRSRYAPTRRDADSATRSSQLRSVYLRGRSYLDTTYQAFLSLPPEQRYIIYFAVAVKALILGVVLYIGPEAMFNATAKLAIWFGSQSYGAALLIVLVVIVSFPPLIGYGTSITLFGLGWGVHAEATSEHAELRGNLLQAWLLASFACLLGATISFAVLRFLIVHHSKRVAWISKTLNDPKYTALSTAVRRRGLFMAILIRFCPFPFAYSNLFFASLVDAVTFKHFFMATALITPKLLLHVWLGTRMFQLMDRDQRAQLDGWAKFLNVVYIAVGSAVGAATGWIVWNETTKVLEAIEREAQSENAPRGHGAESHQRRTAESPYRDAQEGSKKREDASEASPFVLDFDADADEEQEEDQVGTSQKRRDDTAKQSLLPR
ncbi:putative Golgi apparatus membrane protein TVP38 (putative) [Pseudozyma hubeiensis]|nr:putative Golgi apparatus membrane protein TVP38 (putative) [Pseudozyma hubeiensis]